LPVIAGLVTFELTVVVVDVELAETVSVMSQLVKDTLSPWVSSTTYKLQVPFAGAPVKALVKVAVPAGAAFRVTAGAGVGYVVGVESLIEPGFTEMPPVSAGQTVAGLGIEVALVSARFRVTLFRFAPTPLQLESPGSWSNSKVRLSGETSIMAVLERQVPLLPSAASPCRTILTPVTVPGAPDTVKLEG
jgi:hypothetical protein